MFSAGVIADNRSTSSILTVGFTADKGNTSWGYSIQDIGGTGGDSTPGSIEPRFIEVNGITHEIFRFINQPFTSGTALWVLGGTQEDSNNVVLTQDSITSISTDLGVLHTNNLGSRAGSGGTQITGNFSSFDIAGGRKMNKWQFVTDGVGQLGATLPNIIGNYEHSTFFEVAI